ncbi:MAG: flagellar assembly protein FliW [Candidatus Omnitrophica bacterium]|nr:flagellar assembly protein FliW [Candidatus Omnitrophota bacterium]
MSEVKNIDYQVLDLKKENIFTFSEGIPGFEKVQRFAILTNPEEAPFGRLTAIEHDLCFIIINPWTVYPEYKPDIDQEDIDKIESPSNEEILILAIVTIPEGAPQEATMNLVAPLIIHTKKGLGRQVILNNYKEYSSKYRLWKDLE